MATAADFAARLATLDPVRAALAGTPVPPGALTDYSPDGRAARAELLRGTDPGDDAALAERLTAEAAHAEAFLDAEVNLIASPPMQLREHVTALLAAGDPEASAEALAGVPRALRGYAETLRHAPVAPVRNQVEMVLGAVRSWADGGVEFGDTPEAAAARAGYAELADVLATEVLPGSRDEPGIGPDRYRAAARFHLGEDVSPEDLRAGLLTELERVRAECAALAPEGVRAACAAFDADPAWQVAGPAELRAWLVARVGAASTDLPVTGLGELEVDVREEPGPVRYQPPAADGSRRGRLVWPVSDPAPRPMWSQVTTVHHEGVPGHHVQLGAAPLPACGPVAGNSEGWAVHAEGLALAAGALPTRAEHLGYLLGLRLNAAMALADLSVHTGVPLGDTGHPWSVQAAAEFLAEESAFDAGGLYFTVLRSAAWPGQALTYTWGALAWQDLADRAGNRRDFYAEALALGPIGLAPLRAALRR
ncbi:hypothetical protein BJP25_23985 [Actinokineospora bangkokensis]|uniref:DUF885 domain-containing protein n=2 Tax=Actinokineospora bangkokensis TaxID=1193682 RepID=A0A1Q9LIS4_9PSEU|nr:hypothetical protein BJP25_23985 [Actinokineospora bangkokensis]